VQFAGSVSEAFHFRLTPERDNYCFEVLRPACMPQVARVVDEFMMSLILTALRWLVGRDFAPLQIRFMHQKPAAVAGHLRALGCMPVFNASGCAVLLSEEQLNWRLAYSDEVMVKIHDRHVLQRLENPTTTQLTTRVRRAVQRNLNHGEPTLGAVAAQMDLSERTLQRRLQIEGVRFNELVSEERQELFYVYLCNGNMPFKKMAYLLGFSDQSSFNRAVHRWTGRTPGALRNLRHSIPVQASALSEA
jgi:AraC-like DNA-binding protein